jgi:glycosyltransferase involved in cell wall biosynthesis
MAAHNVILQPLRWLGVKVVTTVHNEFDKAVWIMGLADRVVSVSRAGAEAMIKRGVSRDRSRVVLNGSVDSPRLPDQFEKANLRGRVVLSLCGLHHRKGVADLIHAFQKVSTEAPDAELYIGGEGPSLADYVALTQTLGIEKKVHFLGFLDDPRPYLYAADIFVLASHADPGPLVIAEARRAGCAVIATQVDGIPEMLEHGKAGILVEPKNPTQLAASILNLLNDPSALAYYRAAALQNTDRFTIHRVCNDMDVIYAELIGLGSSAKAVTELPSQLS